MSILPRCTCDYFNSVFGEWSEKCPRHAGSARWMQRQLEQRAERLTALRQAALTRPVHGGYPDAPAGMEGKANGN